MSISYSIHITIDQQFSYQNILNILKEAGESGFVYYKDILDVEPLCDLKEISNKVLLSNDDNLENYIYIKFQDTDFLLGFHKGDNDICELSIFSFGYTWKKEFNNDEYMIDFARYIRLLIKVFGSFNILKLETVEI